MKSCQCFLMRNPLAEIPLFSWTHVTMVKSIANSHSRIMAKKIILSQIWTLSGRLRKLGSQADVLNVLCACSLETASQHTDFFLQCLYCYYNRLKGHTVCEQWAAPRNKRGKGEKLPGPTGKLILLWNSSAPNQAFISERWLDMQQLKSLIKVSLH